MSEHRVHSPSQNCTLVTKTLVAKLRNRKIDDKEVIMQEYASIIIKIVMSYLIKYHFKG